MFNPSQYPTNFTYQIPYQSNTINPNNNSFWSFPQPVLPSVVASDPSPHPPGTDPYAHSGSYPLTHVGFQGQAPFGEDPYAGSQSWVVKQAEPTGYEASIKSLNESLLVPTTSNSLWNSNWTNQPLANNATKSIPQQTKVIQFMKCDVCNVNCNSKEIYDGHILGKKHQRKLRMQNNPTAAAAFPETSNATNNISLPSQTSSVGGQVIFGSSGVGLETKRRKILNSGAAVDSVRFCTICKVACNSQEVYDKHLFGKRHKAQATLMALDVGQYFAAVRSQFNGIWKKDPNKTKFVQSVWCEVCKINCNSNDAYIKHLAGKKHQKNLEQLGKLKNDCSAPTPNVPSSSATNAIIGPMENPGAKSLKASQSQYPEEGLETKKRKVISGGAAAGAVRTCTVCNVVCNSQTVFSSHLAGQKHAAMVKKQAEAGMAITGPQLVTAS